MAIVRNIVKLRNLKICMESVGMRPYKCAEVKKKKILRLILMSCR